MEGETSTETTLLITIVALPLVILLIALCSSIFTMMNSSEGLEYIRYIINTVVASSIAILNIFIYKIVINNVDKYNIRGRRS